MAPMRVDHVESHVHAMVAARLVELRDELSRAPESAEQAIPQDFASKRARIVMRRERFVEAFADGHMTREVLRDKVAKLDAELMGIDALDASAKAPSPLKNTRVRRDALREVGNLKMAWRGASAQTKRKLMALLAERAAITKDEAPVITWRSAEDLLINTLEG